MIKLNRLNGREIRWLELSIDESHQNPRIILSTPKNPGKSWKKTPSKCKLPNPINMCDTSDIISFLCADMDFLVLGLIALVMMDNCYSTGESIWIIQLLDLMRDTFPNSSFCCWYQFISSTKQLKFYVKSIPNGQIIFALKNWSSCEI